MNRIGLIVPYKYEGTWVFDDPAVGLRREPFVAGIDTMIDRLVASIPNAEAGFRLLFSASPFPATRSRSSGVAKNTAAIGTTPVSSTWKVGSAPRSSSTSIKPRRSYTYARNRSSGERRSPESRHLTILG